MDLNNTQVYEYKILTEKIIFADGISRTGKAMLSNLLLGFEKMSSIQFINTFEQLMPMYIHGKITKDAFSGYLRLFFNENLYNYKLSRNINFRYDDLTSIYNTSDPSEFHRNLAKPDGDNIVDELYEEDIYFQYQTHDLLTHYSSFLELDIDAYIIELFRHPVDTIHSWYKRGWGTRFDNVDPRSGTALFKYNHKTIPHYAIGKEEYYLTLNEMEKCVFMHNSLQRKSVNEYKKLNDLQKSKILIVKYEDLLNDPDKEMERFGDFLKINKTEHMKKMYKDARVPRVLNLEDRQKKLDEIKNKVSIEVLEDLLELVDDYEKFFFDIKMN